MPNDKIITSLVLGCVSPLLGYYLSYNISHLNLLCVRGDVINVERVLMKAQQEADKERTKEIMRLRGYLMNNSYGLRDYRLEVNGEGLRGLGVVEGNADKLFADRMKKRGMNWTRSGAFRMAKLINLHHSGKLDAGKKLSNDEHKCTLPQATHRL